MEAYGTASAGKLRTVESLGGHAIDYQRSDFLGKAGSATRTFWNAWPAATTS
jgi:hypothetical protein